MNSKNSKCLVLNADYSPLTIIDWQRAITLLFKYNDIEYSPIEAIDYYKNDFILGANANYRIPAVIRTKKYFKIGSHLVNFSRRNLFIRDNFSCQYCGKHISQTKLTYDHVIPKSLWTKTSSPTTWTNIVTACVACNNKKGNKTLDQAKMTLRVKPYQPKKSMKYLPITHFLSSIRENIPEEWTLYLSEPYAIVHI